MSILLTLDYLTGNMALVNIAPKIIYIITGSNVGANAALSLLGP
jgi:hypothetical protein